MGNSNSEEQDDLSLYSFLKLCFFLVSGVLLWITIWVNVTDFFSLINAPIMYTCSIGLTFYGKIPQSQDGKWRRNIAVKYSLIVLLLCIVALFVVNKIPFLNIILLIGKVLFSCIPLLPSYFSILDYSEETKTVQRARKRTRANLEEESRKREQERTEKPQRQKGQNREQIKKKIEDNEGKNRE
ncbi:hypothetical protein [Listeria ilorinensis]|uniref:hypothetical protein n=1 Tax=Listeria ilorinensis TaxID=2867439 RepID=UPI001EF61E15|nr:hypothetical protein [Listeria ilorinensis]